ncbi:uncharacterized protein MELLADRAFT_79846 [Melampsora larici-populina 98AG31]|uniref:Ysc84 actin-binding domain-containing protein n=1 Tax=Melampsora larici-populina (strain 98AG31 / pathotype 3-4-7) TaxID=747676 RepID=F4SDR2_MELLP|nr:uncharacterized protein MELLADRAFT_79846 [Melampsora larici-populina 98AG31]EGF97215.1 hypothetical protein MELLADRAFT_79846 [Melampsora larici-populina 98AG31]
MNTQPLNFSTEHRLQRSGSVSATTRPQSMYQFRRNTETTRRFQLEHDGDADAELRRQQHIEKARGMAKVSHPSKPNTGLDWLWKKSTVLGSWINKEADKTSSESVAFWPTSLDKECDKCARILYTFSQRQSSQPLTIEHDSYSFRKTQKVIKTIPVSVIQQAEGLAIFTVFRTSPGWTAASGSGIVISRDSPTTWGPPSGILIHTVGVNFLAGIDVYDVVLVLRTREAVMAFATPKVSLGISLPVVAGPVGNSLNLEAVSPDSPAFAYTKSKGIYGGLQLEGNSADENTKFMGRRIRAEQLFNGGAVAVPRAALGLISTIEVAEGKPVDPDDLPDDIDVAPSEKSSGVSTVQESRQRARTEVVDEGTTEATIVKSTPLTLTNADRAARRRTLPPLPLCLPQTPQQATASGCLSADHAVPLNSVNEELEMIKPRPELPPIPPRRRKVSSTPSTPGTVEDSVTTRVRGSTELSSSHVSVSSTLLEQEVFVDADDAQVTSKLHSPSLSQTSIKIVEADE